MFASDDVSAINAATGQFTLVSVRCLAAGNSYTAHQAIRAKIIASPGLDWQDIRQRALKAARQFAQAAPSDVETHRAYHEGGAPETAASAFSLLAIAIQRLAGVEASWWQATEPDAEGASFASYECKSHDAGVATAKMVSLLLIDAMGHEPGGSVEKAAAPLFDRISLYGKLLRHVMAAGAAERLGIPWSLVASTGYPTVALGHGKHRRLFWRHLTPATSVVGEMLANSKPLGAEILRKAGLPVPLHRVVTELNAALDAARVIGWPVVIKPTNGGRGIGVTARIADEETLASGFKEARQHGPVLVEKHVVGESYRVLVYKGRCISVTHDVAARVVGDGIHSVAELVAITNRTRTDKLSSSWKKITIDDAGMAALRRQGIGRDDIPEAGQAVYLRLNSNLSAGGTAENVTRSFHPDNKRLAITAAALLEVDLAGVDMIVPDGARSYHDVGGAIIEVNTNPGFEMGEADHVIDDIVVGEFFPAPDRGRIPVVAVMQQDGDLGLNRLPELFGDDRAPCAVAHADVITVGSSVISTGALHLAQRTGRVLSDPAAATAVIFMTPNEFTGQGIGCGRIALAVAAPPWSETMDASFPGLAALADAVIIPDHWLPDYHTWRGRDDSLWVVNANAEKSSGASNEIAWRGTDNAILLRSVGAPELVIARVEPAKRRDIVLTLAAIGAALAIPSAQIGEYLVAYWDESKCRSPV